MSSAFQNYAIYRLRAFTRLISGFHRERIPVLHFSELDTDNSDLDVSLRLRRTFENLKSAASSGSDLQNAQARITRQLGVLQKAEDHTRQAFSAWHGLIQEYSKQPLLPPTVCSIVEDMAIALPDLAQGEAPWSPLDDQPETSGEDGSRQQVMTALDDLANRISKDLPLTEAELSGPQQVLRLQQEQMTALHEVLVKREGFRQKPFEWNYEGLKPLLLHEVLASGRGMTLSLCILFSCVARRLGLILTPVPATLTGYGNEASILGVPDVPTWLLRHDGNMQKPNLTVSTLDTAFWDPVRGSIMDSRQCLDTYPGFPGIALEGRQAVLRVSTELLRTAVVAHQRRGDSDAVAHCFNQLLALDLTDPAWDAVLASGAS
ncbi:g11604 [Coccomyxa viridis]|uniref:G11604 protein n=1 Tax=Coccomyxa viridis TaxID=1274662 RepID=A0ABP1G8B7_9CHLO